MFRHTLASIIMSMFRPSFKIAPIAANSRGSILEKAGKGQKRSARPKPSGAAAAKRAATKRNNIRKHK